MPEPADIPHKSRYSQIAARLEGWLSTYFCPPGDGSGGIGGPLATYWASSPYMAGPYVMNSYGTIRGLCARARDENAGEARRRAENLALYYLRSQDPTTGMMVCCWGEGPLQGLGLVQQASVVAALADLQRLWPQPEVQRAVELAWRACLHHRPLQFGWQVHNQALRACEALILHIRARGEQRPRPAERALLEQVGRRVAAAQLPEGAPGAGAVRQSLAHDDIIMPYQGKCLQPLLMLAEILEAPQYLAVARRLADFILRNLEAGDGNGLIQGQYYAQGEGLPRGRQLYRCRRLFPFLEPALRRHRQRRISHWRWLPWPQWIARGLDTARGLYHLGQAVGETQYTQAGLALVQAALEYQTPLGGIRNTRGFFGEDPGNAEGPVWQDAVAVPRWNSYAVQFLHELAAGEPVLEPVKPAAEARDEVALATGQTLVETPGELRLLSREGGLVWKLTKGHRWGRPFRPLAQWDEGAAFSGRKGIV